MDSLGKLVREWRLKSGLSQNDLAALINKQNGIPVSHQKIQQLEDKGNRMPKYIAELAAAMGTTVQDLLALRMPPKLGDPPAAPTPQPRQHAVGDVDLAILKAVKKLYNEEWINQLLARAVLDDEPAEQTPSPPQTEQFIGQTSAKVKRVAR